MQKSTLYTGKICINRDLSVEVAGVTDEQVQEGIYTQLREQVIQEYINGQSFKTEFSYSNIRLLELATIYS